MTAPIGPGFGAAAVLALRAEILQRNPAIAAPATASAAPAAGPASAGFGQAMATALQTVNALQASSSAGAEAYERGETHDIASVMIARQKASVAFEATLQARNRLLTAYRDVLSMPV